MNVMVPAVALSIILPLSYSLPVTVHSADRNDEQVRTFKRVPVLNEQQASAYLDYVEVLLSNEQPDQALPVVRLLSAADGVPESIRQRAQQLLDEPETADFPRIDWNGNLSLFASVTADDDVGGDNNGRLDAFDADASLTLLYTHNQSISGLLEVGVASGTFLDEDLELSSDPEFYRDETWVNMDFSAPSFHRSLKLGRQSVAENRGWWWDGTLDLLYLSVSRDQWALQTGIGREATYRLFGEQLDGTDEVVRGLGELTYEWRAQHTVSALVFGDLDQSGGLRPGTAVDAEIVDDSGRDLYWLGVRGQGVIDRGEWPAVDYWIDVAHVGGEEFRYDLETDESGEENLRVSSRKKRQLDGWGLDVGVSTETTLPAQPRLHIGFARTSRDADVSDDNDRTFRQTGLHSNEMQLDSFHDASYYGLVLNPELSNLQILTLGIGFDVLSNSYLSLLAHDYRLLTATENLRDANVDLTFNGIDTQVGREIDLVLSVAEWDTWDFTVLFGVFEAGKAVTAAANSTAYNGSIELTVGF